MKKIKLFLLTGIFTLIGIFNFSSAWESTVYCDKDTSGCSYRNLEACCPVPKLISFTCTSEGQIVVVKSSPEGNLFGYTFDCPGVYTTNNPSRLIVGYGKGDGFTSGFYVTDTNVMPVSELTPVITGLKDTTFQLIPLVVYIGIGLLIVTLGFYAIRWLVNWIVGKINSNFSSKRV